jgi:hypothetical protein
MELTLHKRSELQASLSSTSNPRISTLEEKEKQDDETCSYTRKACLFSCLHDLDLWFAPKEEGGSVLRERREHKKIVLT